MPPLSERSSTVLITGAAGDIGRSLVNAFASPGMRLGLCDLRFNDAFAATVTSARERGALVFQREVDVTDATSMSAFVEAAAQECGGIDICIANAGIVERGAIVDQSVDAWRRTLEVNLTGSFLTAQSAARVMLRQERGGQIVFISSWVQDHPRAGIGAYCASKGGLKMLAKCLALELAPQGIRVNLVAPGWVDAGLTSQNIERHPELADEMRSQIPLGRLVGADELAGTVRLLCSDEAAYLTGTTLLVDGGSSLCYRKPAKR